MKKLILLAMLATAAMATTAHAEGYYLGAATGINIPHNGTFRSDAGESKVLYNSGYNIDIAAGYNFDGYRLEGEVGNKRAELDSGLGTRIDITSFMANAYVDFDREGRFTPYIGAGLGLLHGELNSTTAGFRAETLGVQGMIGTAVSLGRQTSLDLSYRLLGTTARFTSHSGELPYLSSNVRVGLRYDF